MGWLGHHDGSIEHYIPNTRKWSDGKPRHKLNDCQRCGASQEKKRVFLWYVNGGWCVICADCHYHHKAAKTEKDAVKVWNEQKGQQT